jgi:hypothetical protein
MRTAALLVCGLIAVFSAVGAQEEGKAHYEHSCQVHIKSAVYPSDPFDKAGKARVYVTVTTKEGAPIPDQEVFFSATCGTFSCKPLDSEDTTSIDSTLIGCDRTDKNGKAMVYIVNIPFNNQGGVTAECYYNSLYVKATCTFLITRYAVKDKPRKTPKG